MQINKMISLRYLYFQNQHYSKTISVISLMLAIVQMEESSSNLLLIETKQVQDLGQGNKTEELKQEAGADPSKLIQKL